MSHFNIPIVTDELCPPDKVYLVPQSIIERHFMHPSTKALLKYFQYSHLPEHLKEVSKPFGDLAFKLVTDFNLDGPELTVALRKLLEAKDCAVRAAL